MKSSLNGLFGSILDFVYPPLCLCCLELLADSREHICDSCWDSIRRVDPDSSLFVETRDKLIGSLVVDGLACSFVFEKEGSLQAVMHALKYGGIQSLGVKLGESLGRVLTDEALRADYIIPIPLHKRKLRERGYNQAELIARGASRMLGIPVLTNLVRRRRFTQTQTALSFEERQLNMEGAFELAPGKAECVADRRFIVVDDVITTGATIEACGRVLKHGGAKIVIAASAAVAQKDEAPVLDRRDR